MSERLCGCVLEWVLEWVLECMRESAWTFPNGLSIDSASAWFGQSLVQSEFGSVSAWFGQSLVQSVLGSVSDWFSQ